MTIIAWLPILILIAGGLVYLLARNAKIAELGRIAYFVGLFFMTWHFASRILRL